MSQIRSSSREGERFWVDLEREHDLAPPLFGWTPTPQEPPQHGIKLYSLCSARVHPLLPITSSSGKLHLKHHDGSKTGNSVSEDTSHAALELPQTWERCGTRVVPRERNANAVCIVRMHVDDHLEYNVEDLQAVVYFSLPIVIHPLVIKQKMTCGQSTVFIAHAFHGFVMVSTSLSFPLLALPLISPPIQYLSPTELIDVPSPPV
ncbi:hypothetical protein M404DRAFT_26027 [Pisolithus tinctorius Marx 270]|uniref:Uncharacterized protein n=1 Tax=Pisolithus tinctorius Marx 270 TaxID=870435 RepID=A0A0C3NUJ1_PISTI|nr:hypothetical protein M404DRAFT_26027 [Pisolithus tinctorius Marx 270]